MFMWFSADGEARFWLEPHAGMPGSDHGNCLKAGRFVPDSRSFYALKAQFCL
jgi:hypothetical protein